MNRLVEGRQAVFAAVSAAAGAALSLLGGWDFTLQAMVGFMAADYLTGLLVGGVFHCSAKTESGALESRAGRKGLARKFAMLAPVFLGALLDRAAGTDFVRPAVCLFFTANEGLSVLENLGLMGVRYPAFLKNMLGALREKGNGGETVEKEGKD